MSGDLPGLPDGIEVIPDAGVPVGTVAVGRRAGAGGWQVLAHITGTQVGADGVMHIEQVRPRIDVLEQPLTVRPGTAARMAAAAAEREPRWDAACGQVRRDHNHWRYPDGQVAHLPDTHLIGRSIRDAARAARHVIPATATAIERMRRTEHDLMMHGDVFVEVPRATDRAAAREYLEGVTPIGYTTPGSDYFDRNNPQP